MTSLVKVDNKRVYIIENSILTSITSVIITKEYGGLGSVKAASVDPFVVIEANERMNLFKSKLFAVPIFKQKGKVYYFKLATITDEMKELFASASSTSD